MPYFTTPDGCNIFYRTYGVDLSKPVVVFLNGTTQTTLYWGNHVPVFAKGYGLLFYDARGQGQSDPGTASISLEPGAQLELSGSPLPTIHQVRGELNEHLRELQAIDERLGVAWLASGFHPLARQAELPWVPKERYRIMRDYFPSRGQSGIDMMRRTATVQVNLDYTDEADAMTKLRVALKLSPVATAMSASQSNCRLALQPLLSEVVNTRLRFPSVLNSPSAGIAISFSTCSGVAPG